MRSRSVGLAVHLDHIPLLFPCIQGIVSADIAVRIFDIVLGVIPLLCRQFTVLS